MKQYLAQNETKQTTLDEFDLSRLLQKSTIFFFIWAWVAKECCYLISVCNIKAIAKALRPTYIEILRYVNPAFQCPTKRLL